MQIELKSKNFTRVEDLLSKRSVQSFLALNLALKNVLSNSGGICNRTLSSSVFQQIRSLSSHLIRSIVPLFESLQAKAFFSRVLNPNFGFHPFSKSKKTNYD